MRTGRVGHTATMSLEVAHGFIKWSRTQMALATSTSESSAVGAHDETRVSCSPLCLAATARIGRTRNVLCKPHDPVSEMFTVCR